MIEEVRIGDATLYCGSISSADSCYNSIMTRRGYKQTKEHIEKRKRFGSDHHLWLGDDVSERGGRTRALRSYPVIGPCSKCGNEKAERHHKDGNTANNSPENVIALCRRCHTIEHGKTLTPRAIKLGNKKAAKLKRSITHCPQGHPYSGENLYTYPDGRRSCKICTRDAKRRYRARGGHG